MTSSTDQMCSYHYKKMTSSTGQMCTCNYKKDTFINISTVHVPLQDKWLHQQIKCVRITIRKWFHQQVKCAHVTTRRTPSSTYRVCTYHYKTNGFINRSNMHVSLQDKWLHQHIKYARITTRQMASSTYQMCTCNYKKDTFINISNVHISNVHVSYKDKWLHQQIKYAHVTSRGTPSSTYQMYTCITTR